FIGPKATLADPRILTAWRTVTAEALDAAQQTILASNFLVEELFLPNGRRMPLYRHDVRPSNAALPAVCPKAEPKLPVELRPNRDLLNGIEARYRSLRLIVDGQSMLWVGRQSSHETTCICDLTAANNVQRPAVWQDLRELRRLILALVEFAQTHYERRLGPQEVDQLDHLGERVVRLTRAVGLELPSYSAPSEAEDSRPYGP